MNNTDTLGWSDLKNLRKSLGDKSAKVKFHLEDADRPVKRNCIVNSVLYDMQGRRPSDTFCSVNDAIIGACSLTDRLTDKALKATTVYLILQTIHNISTKTIQCMFGMSDRQARKYVQICRILMPVLENTFQKFEESLDIVSEIDDTVVQLKEN